MGPDGTNEVDIEFARWGKASIHPGNFSVWPPAKTVKRKTHSFDFKLNGASSTSCFDWSSTGVKFQTRGGEGNIIEQWGYTPPEPSKYIPQQALPIHMNLWLCDGKTPEDKQEVEVIIKKFTFTPQASH
jgi:hypothetical protein